MCVSYSSDRPFLLPPSWTVLLLDCITCSAPVWLSLVGWWSFLASSEIPVRLSIPEPFHIPLTHPHPPSSLLMMVTKPFLFPDCSASVHKGCRDSLPSCAKVKMKVHIPSACHFFSVLSSSQPKMILFVYVSLWPASQATAYSSRHQFSSCSHDEEQMWVFQLTDITGSSLNIQSSNLYLSLLRFGWFPSIISFMQF